MEGRAEVANRKRLGDTIEELSGRKQSLPFDKMRSEHVSAWTMVGKGMASVSFVFEFLNVLRSIYRHEEFYYHGINRN